MIDNQKIQDLIPHRYPFLLVDKVIELKKGERAVGIKNVTANEPFFQGHFPGNPIMPGVLIAESMAQVGIIALKALNEHKDKLGVLAGMEKFRFKRQIKPGDTLKIEVNLVKMKGNIGIAEGVAYVENEIACKGTIMFGLI